MRLPLGKYEIAVDFMPDFKMGCSNTGISFSWPRQEFQDYCWTCSIGLVFFTIQIDFFLADENVR